MQLGRKGGRLVALRQQLKVLQDENHALQAEVNTLQAMVLCLCFR